MKHAPLITRDARTAHAIRFALWMTLPYFLLIALMNWPYRDLPFWGDSIGYMIANSHSMLERGSVMPPVHHDPGHPPLTFWVLALAWKIFGSGVIISHGVQWLWGAILLSGTFALVLVLSNGSRWLAFLAAGLTILHPVTFAMTMQLVPDVAMGAMLMWTLAMFYAQRRAGYIVAIALLAFTKANAWPQIAIFGLAEFVLVPALQLLRVRRRPNARRVILRWWGKWIGCSLLAAYPLLLWILAHRYYQGFWMQSPSFAATSSITIEWSYFKSELKNDVVWALWSSDGNQALVYAGIFFFLLIIALLLKLRLSGAAKQILRANAEITTARPPRLAVVSLATQCLLTIFVYTLKDEKITRYFYPVILFTIIILVVLMAQSFALAKYFLKHRPRPRDLTFRTVRGIFLITAVLLGANLMIRWHPAFATRLPLPYSVRDSFRNRASLGHEYNLQIVPILYMNRDAIHHIEDLYHQPGAKPVIVANYPFSAAMKYPEAGYLRRHESIRTVNDFQAEDFLHRDWDYFINSPLAWFAHEHEKLPEFPAIAEVTRNFDEPSNSWGYRVLIYRKKQEWRPRKEERRGKAIALLLP